MADHGINVSRADTAVATPNTATCGIPFVIGTAPLSKATGTAATAGLPGSAPAMMRQRSIWAMTTTGPSTPSVR